MGDGDEEGPGEVVAMGAEGNIMSDLHCIVFPRRRCRSGLEEGKGVEEGGEVEVEVEDEEQE